MQFFNFAQQPADTHNNTGSFAILRIYITNLVNQGLAPNVLPVVMPKKALMWTGGVAWWNTWSHNDMRRWQNGFAQPTRKPLY